MSSEPGAPPGASERARRGREGARGGAAEGPAEGSARPEKSELSAGGVVVRGDDVVVIVPTRRAADGSRVLGLPKGHPDGDETPMEAATREVREEAGVTAEPVEELGVVRYRYRRKGREVAKRVRFFLFDYRSGDPADHDHEVEEARWMPMSEAVRRLTYDGEREMVARALARSKPDR